MMKRLSFLSLLFGGPAAALAARPAQANAFVRVRAATVEYDQEVPGQEIWFRPSDVDSIYHGRRAVSLRSGVVFNVFDADWPKVVVAVKGTE